MREIDIEGENALDKIKDTNDDLNKKLNELNKQLNNDSTGKKKKPKKGKLKRNNKQSLYHKEKKQA